MNWNDIRDLVPAPGGRVDYDACLKAFPMLELAKATPQDARWHAEGDVFTHTTMVVDTLVGMPVYGHASRDARTVLFLAALLHDVAKHATTVIDPVTGAIGQPGHSRRGAIDARVALWTAGAPFLMREAVCALVQNHQVPFHAIEGSRDGKSAEFIVRELSWRIDLRLLTALAEADMRGRICSDQQRALDNIELFAELAREDGCWGVPRPFADPHTRVSYFRGAQVHPDFPLFKKPGSAVEVLAGLPAVGKNTYAQAAFSGLPVLSFDDARDELGLAHGENDGKAAHLVLDRAREFLRRRAPFVWNATNIDPLLRKKALDLLYAYSAEVRMTYLEAGRCEIFTRNARRDTTLSHKKLERMLWKWEPPGLTEVPALSVRVDGASVDPCPNLRASGPATSSY